jgi:hypothetical protein
MFTDKMVDSVRHPFSIFLEISAAQWCVVSGRISVQLSMSVALSLVPFSLHDGATAACQILRMPETIPKSKSRSARGLDLTGSVGRGLLGQRLRLDSARIRHHDCLRVPGRLGGVS